MRTLPRHTAACKSAATSAPETTAEFDPRQNPILAQHWPDLVPEPLAVVNTSVASSDVSARQA